MTKHVLTFECNTTTDLDCVMQNLFGSSTSGSPPSVPLRKVSQPTNNEYTPTHRRHTNSHKSPIAAIRSMPTKARPFRVSVPKFRHSLGNTRIIARSSVFSSFHASFIVAPAKPGECSASSPHPLENRPASETSERLESDRSRSGLYARANSFEIYPVDRNGLDRVHHSNQI